MSQNTADKIKEAVRENYGGLAREYGGSKRKASCCGPAPNQASCCGPTREQRSCCGSSAPEVSSTGAADRIYSAEELAGVPEGASDMALGCGNPTAIADLKPGEVVLDLGSGGGIDCFLAAKKVGPSGRVIGLDMTPEMILTAQRNAKQAGLSNVEFRLGEIEDMPLPDASVDVIISNCVINLSPDKDAVFAEAYRVLRPGGRLTVSDIVTYGEMPESIRGRLDVWASCVGGAIAEAEYLDKMRAAGLVDVQVLSRDYVQVSEFVDWGPMREMLRESGLTAAQMDKLAASVRVRAVKPSL